MNKMNFITNANVCYERKTRIILSIVKTQTNKCKKHNLLL